ncbi:uncharacterized protein LOC111261636 isoform X2 [Varroa jacobsoni]|uniref:uncharacterized protein LOC111261636 isoform X2 n=1 Tax=Varroa jacobsoni TaxID=62625 RepID=UPI000BF28BD6|nr:uncharacterized protein LOC111261636 isoform X2 [Varroa jacobsoni]
MSRLRKIFSRKSITAIAAPFTFQDSQTGVLEVNTSSRGSSYLNLDSELDSDMDKMIPVVQDHPLSRASLRAENNNTVDVQQLESYIGTAKNFRDYPTGEKNDQNRSRVSLEKPNTNLSMMLGSSAGSSSLEEEGTASDPEEGLSEPFTKDRVSFVGVDPPGVSPPDSPEVGGLVSPGPKVMSIPPTPRSVSMILPSKSPESVEDSTDDQEDEGQASEALIAGAVANGNARIVGPQISDDSGIGANGGAERGSMAGGASLKRSLHIDIPNPRPVISRASSYGGSVSSLPITPKGGGLRHIGPNDKDSLVIILSALYAKLLIVLGICFPMAEVISRRIPPAVYEGFYLYLYLGSIFFLLFMYCFVFPKQKATRVPKRTNSRISEYTASMLDKFRIITKTRADRSNKVPAYELKTSHAGSFYLRLGAVAFGTGSMIYSGLEFGQFFEYESTDQCSILHNLTPATRMAFTFFQLYFIFINSRVAINRFTTLARFGLMHMISSNLCVWLHVLIQETKHQIFDLASNETHQPHVIRADLLGSVTSETNRSASSHVTDQAVPHVQRSRRSFPDSYCGQRANIMGELVQNASPFLFPCTIEYSLICAGVLYIMWKNVSSSKIVSSDTASVTIYAARQRHYYQVDCAKANKDASRRYVASHDQAERKPGREMVTFLILCNFSMWAINTLETRRADSNPVQMHFYGFWAWTIITHVTAPLVIFFRFHSTVCLCDIWKRAYKVKSDYLT